MMDVDVITLHQRFTDLDIDFQQCLDVAKMALVLFAGTFIFGTNFRKKVSSWLFSLVEKLD